MSETAGSEPGVRALFRRDGDLVVPTNLARGPWRPDALHGGAVAALLASALDTRGRTPARVTFDLLAAVPCEPLTLQATELEGGERVARQTVTLLAGDKVVARASALAVRVATLDLPESIGEPHNPFEGAEVPDLTRNKPVVREMIGWECFDSDALCVRGLSRDRRPPGMSAYYLNLMVPVIDGEPTTPLSRAAAAADYASSHVGSLLPFDEWSYMNADITLHLSRLPADSWIGMASNALIEPNGAGVTLAQMFDPAGRIGRSSQVLVVESRRRVSQESSTPAPGD